MFIYPNVSSGPWPVGSQAILCVLPWCWAAFVEKDFSLASAFPLCSLPHPVLCSLFLQTACAYVCLITNGGVLGGDRGKEEWRCESNWDASLARRLSLVPLRVFKGLELFRPFFLLIHLTFIYWVILCAKHFLGTGDLALNKANFLLSWNLHSIRQLKN